MEENYDEYYDETSYLPGVYIAARDGDLEAAKASQEDINELVTPAEGSSMTALQIASYEGHVDIVKYLLDNNADTDMTGSFGDVNGTPLHFAAERGHFKVMDELLSHGANINLTDGTYDYFTVLHSACRNGKLDVVKYLLEHGADINALDGAGNTPLMIACENGHLVVIKFLLSKGATLKVVSMLHTPLLFASENGHMEVVTFLVENGVEVNGGAQFRKDTALHVSAQNGYPEVVNYLLQHGADKKAVNNDGKTPYEIAAPETKDLVK